MVPARRAVAAWIRLDRGVLVLDGNQHDVGTRGARAQRRDQCQTQTGRDEALLGGPLPHREVDAGSKPARRHAATRAPVPDGLPSIQLSAARSASRRTPAPAREWPFGRATSSGSSTRNRNAYRVSSIRSLRVRVGADDREVDLVAVQRHQQIRRVGLGQREIHPRVLGPERGERPGHQRRLRRVEGAQPQPAGVERAQRGEVAARGRQPIEDGVSVTEQAAPVVGEPHAAGEPVEQPGTGVPFQRGDLARHGRLGVAQGGRCRGQRSGRAPPRGRPPARRCPRSRFSHGCHAIYSMVASIGAL